MALAITPSLQIPENSERGEQAAKRHVHGISATTARAYALQGTILRPVDASSLLLHQASIRMSTAFSPWRVVFPVTIVPCLAAQKVFWNLEPIPIDNSLVYMLCWLSTAHCCNRYRISEARPIPWRATRPGHERRPSPFSRRVRCAINPFNMKRTRFLYARRGTDARPPRTNIGQ